jgi:hypothetical protein
MSLGQLSYPNGNPSIEVSDEGMRFVVISLINLLGTQTAFSRYPCLKLFFVTEPEQNALDAVVLATWSYKEMTTRLR